MMPAPDVPPHRSFRRLTLGVLIVLLIALCQSLNWEFIEGILRYPTESYYPSYKDHITTHGPLSVLLHALLVLSVPAALYVILRKRELPWSLLASMAPFTVASLICHFHSETWFAFWSVPDATHTAASLAFDIRLFWSASITSFALVVLSFLSARA